MAKNQKVVYTDEIQTQIEDPNSTDVSDDWALMFQVYRKHRLEKHPEFFLNNLVMVYNHWCRVANVKREYAYYDDESRNVTHLDAYSLKGQLPFAQVQAEPDTDVMDEKYTYNIYPYHVLIAIKYEKYYQTSYEKKVYKQLINLLKDIISYIFKPYINEPGFTNIDINNLIFNYNSLFRNNPCVYSKLLILEKKSFIDYIESKLGEYEDCLILNWFDIFRSEKESSGQKFVYYAKTRQIKEFDYTLKFDQLEINAMKKEEYQTADSELVKKIRHSKRLSINQIKLEEGPLFDDVIRAINDIVNVRYIVKSSVESENYYYKPYNQFCVRNNYKHYLNTNVENKSYDNFMYGSIMVLDDYQDLYKVYKFISTVVINYKDSEGNPIYVDEVKNLYARKYFEEKANYGYDVNDYTQKPRYIQFMFSKLVKGFNAYFRLKLFTKDHWNNYNVYFSAFSWEKDRYFNRQVNMSLYTKYEMKYLYPEIIKDSYRHPIENRGYDEYWKLYYENQNLESEIYYTKKQIWSCNDYIEHLNKQDIIKYNREFSCNQWMILLLTMVFFIILPLISFTGGMIVSQNSNTLDRHSSLKAAVYDNFVQHDVVSGTFENMQQYVTTYEATVQQLPVNSNKFKTSMDVLMSSSDSVIAWSKVVCTNAIETLRNQYDIQYSALDTMLENNRDEINRNLKDHQDSELVDVENTKPNHIDTMDTYTLNINDNLSSIDNTFLKSMLHLDQEATYSTDVKTASLIEQIVRGDDTRINIGTNMMDDGKAFPQIDTQTSLITDLVDTFAAPELVIVSDIDTLLMNTYDLVFMSPEPLDDYRDVASDLLQNMNTDTADIQDANRTASISLLDTKLTNYKTKLDSFESNLDSHMGDIYDAVTAAHTAFQDDTTDRMTNVYTDAVVTLETDTNLDAVMTHLDDTHATANSLYDSIADVSISDAIDAQDNIVALIDTNRVLIIDTYDLYYTNITGVATDSKDNTIADIQDAKTHITDNYNTDTTSIEDSMLTAVDDWHTATVDLTFTHFDDYSVATTGTIAVDNLLTQDTLNDSFYATYFDTLYTSKYDTVFDSIASEIDTYDGKVIANMQTQIDKWDSLLTSEVDDMAAVIDERATQQYANLDNKLLKLFYQQIVYETDDYYNLSDANLVDKATKLDTLITAVSSDMMAYYDTNDTQVINQLTSVAASVKALVLSQRDTLQDSQDTLRYNITTYTSSVNSISNSSYNLLYYTVDSVDYGPNVDLVTIKSHYGV